MKEQTEIPDDWIPLTKFDADGKENGDPVGGTYLIEGERQLQIVQVKKEPPHDLISLYPDEMKQLVHALVDRI